jgi:hypothetical protein
VVERLLKDATQADFDRRPDPERFTIREVIAHLADWEAVWLERSERAARENEPELPGYDEGQWAIDRDYAHSNVGEQLARFRAGRERYLALLHELQPEAWDRAGRREWGRISVGEQAVLALGHDGYHTLQISEWLRRGE